MPGSARENDQFVKDFVKNNDIRSVLDVGAGKGTYSELLRPMVQTIDAIEVWQPYIDEFDLKNKYDAVFKADARAELFKMRDEWYDLIIFGDILEHMTLHESIGVWEQAKRVGRNGLISVPIIHYPQGAEFGNPYEVHVQEHLTPEEIRKTYGPFDDEALYNITGTFIRRFA